MATAPANITTTLQGIFDDAGMAALSAASPPLAAALNIPIVGPVVSWAITSLTNFLIAQGVIEIKLGILDILTSEAKAKYAPQIAILKAAQAAKTLTPEQEAAYDSALQAIVSNHPGVVNA